MKVGKRKMALKFLIPAALVLFVVGAQAARAQYQFEDKPSLSRRINFARGKNSAVIRNRTKGFEDLHEYILRARAGQHLVADITSPKIVASISIIAPDGQRLTANGEDAFMLWDDELPQTGDYRILVFTGKKDNDRYTLKITVK